MDESSSGDRDHPLDSISARSSLDFSTDTFCRELVANTSDGLLTVDTTETIVFANPAVESVLGYQPAELVGESLATLIPDRFVKDFQQGFDRYIETSQRHMDWDGVELPARHAAGHEVTVSFSFDEHTHGSKRLFTAVLRDVSERRRRQAELERYEDIITHLPAGIYRAEAGPDGTLLDANPALQEILDVPSKEALLEHSTQEFFTDPAVAEELGEKLDREGMLVDEEVELRTATGDRIWTSVTAIRREEREETEIYGVVEDITERKERERMLREQKRSIETILSHIPGILFTVDSDGVFTRSEGQVLENIGLATGEAVGESIYELYADYPGILEDYERALDGEQVDSVVELMGTTFEVTYHPLVDDGAVHAVVGFAYDVTERRERERTLERQRTALERIQQVTESLRPLNRELSRATTREEVEVMVCEQLATSDAYAIAWYGEYDPVSESITPREWAGVEDGYLTAFDVAAVAEDTLRGMAAKAVQTRTVQTAQNVLSDPAMDSIREDALERGYQSAAAVPVVTGETVLGVFGVYSRRPTAFDEYEHGLLSELGERIGQSMQAAETKRLLYTDRVVELTFRSTGSESPFVALSEEFDCRLELEAVTPATGNLSVCYMAVDGVEPAVVVDHLAGSPAIEDARVTTATGTTGTIEYRLRDSPVTTLLELDATVTSHIVENGEATIVAEAAPDAETSRLVTQLQTSFPEIHLVSKTAVDRPLRALDPSGSGSEDLLTDRQREVLAAAYHAGFFNSPRDSTGEELADALGISSPTFYLHVRRGLSRILEWLDEARMFDH